MDNSTEKNDGFTEDKIIKPKSGVAFLFLCIVIELVFMAGIPVSIFLLNITGYAFFEACIVLSIVLTILWLINFGGFKMVSPNQARVFTLFGKYYGVIKEPGFYYVNPFIASVGEKRKRSEDEMLQKYGVNAKSMPQSASYTTSNCISLKTRTLLNNKQKINDELGNPIEISIAVIWKINCVTMALFNVDDYREYLSIQCDSALRNIVRSYPYDLSREEQNNNEKTLRGSASEIADKLQEEIQQKVKIAGLEIIEARITHLAYAPEIAAAMLQRQQASAIVDARQMIVEGAVSMVDMALSKLSSDNIVELDDERKAQMVSNLLVVLCGNKDAQPIVNSGSLY